MIMDDVNDTPGTDCVRVHDAPNWEETRSHISRLASTEHEVYFRGQANAQWRLTSSYGRVFQGLAEQAGWSDDHDRIAQKIERRLWKEFRKAYLRIPGAPDLPSANDNEFVGFCQHHSLPTRLLDWTRSPYIAAFFAFDGCKTNLLPRQRQVAIYAINWTIYKLALYHSHDRTEPAQISLFEPGDLERKLEIIRRANRPRLELIQIRGNPDRRAVYQEGIFTCSIKIEDDVENYLRRIGEFSPGTILTKIVVPGGAQSEALKDLSRMTISPVTLMNDPTGAAATAFNSVVRFASTDFASLNSPDD